MTLVPLEQLRLDPRSHISALRWMSLFYRRPRPFREIELTFAQRTAAVCRIYLHILPYLICVAVIGRWFLSEILGLSSLYATDPDGKQWFGIALGIVIILGFLISFAIGLAFGLSRGFLFASTIWVGTVIATDIADDFARAVVVSFTVGLSFGFFAVPVVKYIYGSGPVSIIIYYVALPALAVGFFFGFTESAAIGLSFGLGLGAGLLVTMLRPYYLLVHGIFFWPQARAGFYRFHPVVWDDVCLIPFPGLDRLLVRFAELDLRAGEREIDRLIDGYPSQRPAALRARAILVARRAAASSRLACLDEILAGLPAGEKGFLKETMELRRRTHEITALQARLDTLDRSFLREPFAALLVKEIESFEQQIAGFMPPLSTELRKAARQWLEIARRQLEAARAAANREPTRQVFRAGDPVDREREAFVLRGAIVGELERQVMLATGCPGLLVYGRRRMGKSTLLRNLEGLLPPAVRVASLSMQEARAFTNVPDLVDLIGRRVAEVVPDGHQPPADLKGFEHFLNVIQTRLNATDGRLLLAIDEYEYLDHKIGEGVLSEDLLAVLRESIQTHRRIIWTFAGSHSIDELVHAPWSSYLVSARTLEVTPFDPAETRLLLTEPLKHSSLWRATDAERPSFEPGFWGDGGIERIHAEAGGWPHLVQLVAETVVDLVNDASATSVDDTLFERALDRAVVRGNNVMLELVEKESRLPGEWDYLRAFRKTEEQPAPEDEAVARSLRRRRLVVEEDGRYRLRVPLMGRWLRQRV